MDKKITVSVKCEYTNREEKKTYTKIFIPATNNYRFPNRTCSNSSCDKLKNCPYENEIIAKLKRLG